MFTLNEKTIWKCFLEKNRGRILQKKNNWRNLVDVKRGGNSLVQKEVLGNSSFLQQFWSLKPNFSTGFMMNYLDWLWFDLLDQSQIFPVFNPKNNEVDYFQL